MKLLTQRSMQIKIVIQTDPLQKYRQKASHILYAVIMALIHQTIHSDMSPAGAEEKK